MSNSPGQLDCSQSTYCSEAELLSQEVLKNANWHLIRKMQAVRDITIHYDESKEEEAHALLEKLRRSKPKCANTQLGVQELIAHLETTISDSENKGFEDAATGVSQRTLVDSAKVPNLLEQHHHSQSMYCKTANRLIGEKEPAVPYQKNTRYNESKQDKARTIFRPESMIFDTQNDIATGMSQCLNFEPNVEEMVNEIKVTEVEETLCTLIIDETGNVVVERVAPVVKITEPYNCEQHLDVKELFTEEKTKSKEDIPTRTSDKRKFEDFEPEEKHLEEKPEIKATVPDTVLIAYRKLEECVKLMEEDRSRFIDRLQARKREILQEKAKKQHVEAAKTDITDLTITQEELDRNKRVLREISAKFKKMYREKNSQNPVENEYEF